jgi:hypothetical protein
VLPRSVELAAQSGRSDFRQLPATGLMQNVDLTGELIIPRKRRDGMQHCCGCGCGCGCGRAE